MEVLLSVVQRRLLEANDPKNYDIYMGWTEGLNAVCQHKDHYSSNYSNYSKRRKSNTWCPQVDYVNIYLQFSERHFTFPTARGYLWAYQRYTEINPQIG